MPREFCRSLWYIPFLPLFSIRANSLSRIVGGFPDTTLSEPLFGIKDMPNYPSSSCQSKSWKEAIENFTIWTKQPYQIRHGICFAGKSFSAIDSCTCSCGSLYFRRAEPNGSKPVLTSGCMECNKLKFKACMKHKNYMLTKIWRTNQKCTFWKPKT